MTTTYAAPGALALVLALAGCGHSDRVDPVGPAIRARHFGAEGFRDGFLDSRIAGEQLMHAAIGIEKLGKQMAA